MTRFAGRRTRLRALIEEGTCLFPASVFDPLSLRIAMELGFETGMFAGSVASLAVLGAPDITLLTLSELAGQMRRMARAGDLPVIVDADHGYGNALNVRRTVEELEMAGAAALSIEDTLLPRGFGASDGAQLLTLEEGVGKVKAALDARGDPELVIAGRTSAAAISGLDDAIERARAYEAAGADVIFLVGLKTRAELDKVADAISKPLVLGAVSEALADRDYLSSRNVVIALQGHLPVRASVQAIYDTMAALREGAAPGEITGIASDELMARLMRFEDYARLNADYLKRDGS